MHPEWFRIGGVADDLPEGWKGLVDDFLSYFPTRIAEYRQDARQELESSRCGPGGVGVYSTESAIEWGVTGPNLRATGFDWDLRKTPALLVLRPVRLRGPHRDRRETATLDAS